MAVTEVRHKLLDAEKEPQVGVVFTARLLAPAGYLLDKSEITSTVQAASGVDGTVRLLLTPISEVEYVGAVYEITWAKQIRYITVPNTGPVNLRDVLTTAPAAGGAVVVPGVAGRSITGQSIDSSGHLILTFDQAPLSVDLGVVNPGPPGTGGTVTVPALTTRPARVIAYKDGVGTTLLKKGQVRFDVVDDFLADPTNVADASTAWANCLGEAASAAASGWDVLVEATGTFRIDSATRLLRKKGVSMRGRDCKLVFRNASGGLSIGDLLDNALGGEIRGFILDGFATARNPLYVGWVNQVDIGKMMVQNGGYYPADTLAVRNKTAGLVVEACQNTDLSRIRVKDTKHHGMVFDFGCGALSFHQMHVSDIGTAGSVDARHILVMQSLPATDPSLPPVYDLPTNIEFRRGYIEGGNSTQANMVELQQSESIQFARQRISCPSRSTAQDQVLVGAQANDVVFDGVAFTGNNSLASGNSVKVVNGVRVMAGAKACRITGPTQLANMAALYNVDDLADLVVETQPLHLTGGAPPHGVGLGVRRVVRSFTVRAATVAGLPTPSADYLGVRGVVSAGPTATYDQLYVCLRQGGAYGWVRATSSDLYTVITHTAGANIVIDSALSTSLSVVAAGNITLGQTVNNTEGRMTLLAVDPGATARTVSFTTAGAGAFRFTTAVPGPTLSIPANKKALIGWRYSGTTNQLVAFTVDA